MLIRDDSGSHYSLSDISILIISVCGNGGLTDDGWVMEGHGAQKDMHVKEENKKQANLSKK